MSKTTKTILIVVVVIVVILLAMRWAGRIGIQLGLAAAEATTESKTE